MSHHKLPFLRNTLSNVYNNVIIDYLELAGVNEKTWPLQSYIYRKFISDLKKEKKTVGVSPHSFYTLSKDTYSSLLEIAEKEKLTYQTHLNETQYETEYCLYNKGNFAKVFQNGAKNIGERPEKILLNLVKDKHFRSNIYNTAAHCVHLKNKDYTLLEKNHILPVVCMRSNQQLKTGKINIEFLIENQIPFLIGTDSLASSPSINIIEESYELIRNINIQHNGSKDSIYKQVFRALTSNLFRDLKNNNQLYAYNNINRLMVYKLPLSEIRDDHSSLSLIKLLLSKKLMHQSTIVGNDFL